MKRALIVAATGGFLNGFLIPDMKLLQEMGYEVHCAANGNSVSTFVPEERFASIGVTFHQIDFSSTSPVSKESLGLAGIEALASGVPVIGSDVQGIKDYVIDGKTGYLCSPRDADAFADKIQLLSDKEARFLMRKACVEKAEEFRLDISHQQMKNIYKNLLREETLWGQPWGKVIRATVFENLCFPEGFWYEDSIFEYCIYPFWKKKYTIENDVYAYRYNLNGITYKSRGNVKSIDHYWIMLYLWDWIKDKQILRSDEWLQISMLDNMVLGYLRTKDLDEKTVQSGFVVLRKRYLSSFANPPRQQNKYILLDKSLRKKDFGQFKLLCDRWRYL